MARNVCRQSFLNELARHFRQSVLFSSFASPEINALVASWSNHSGLVAIAAQHKGVLSRVIPQVCRSRNLMCADWSCIRAVLHAWWPDFSMHRSCAQLRVITN